MFLTIKKEIYKAGDVIFEEGSHGLAVYILQSGKVEISKIVHDRRITVILYSPKIDYVRHKRGIAKRSEL